MNLYNFKKSVFLVDIKCKPYVCIYRNRFIVKMWHWKLIPVVETGIGLWQKNWITFCYLLILLSYIFYTIICLDKKIFKELMRILLFISKDIFKKYPHDSCELLPAKTKNRNKMCITT